MNRISADEAVAEAVSSQADLQREIGRVLPVFAYPAGALSNTVARLLRKKGFALAFTTRHGINDMRRADGLKLCRINVGRHTTREILRVRLHGWSARFNNSNSASV